MVNSFFIQPASSIQKKILCAYEQHIHPVFLHIFCNIPINIPPGAAVLFTAVIVVQKIELLRIRITEPEIYGVHPVFGCKCRLRIFRQYGCVNPDFQSGLEFPKICDHNNITAIISGLQFFIGIYVDPNALGFSGFNLPGRIIRQRVLKAFLFKRNFLLKIITENEAFGNRKIRKTNLAYYKFLPALQEDLIRFIAVARHMQFSCIVRFFRNTHIRFHSV